MMDVQDVPLPEAATDMPDTGEARAPAPSGCHILYVTHRLPYPPRDGARVRAFHSIRHLAKRNRVTVAAPVRSAEEERAADELRGLGHRVLTAPIGEGRARLQAIWHAATWRPASAGYFDAPGLSPAIAAFIREDPIDLAVVHCSAVGHLVAGLTGVPKVLDFVDMDSRKWRDYSRVTPWPRNLVHAWEAFHLGNRERRLAGRFDLSLTATRHEDATLQSMAPATRRAVVRNGVDTDYFCPGDAPYEPDHIVFIGRMDYFPNEQAMCAFCADVLPLVRVRRPEAKLTIVGADPGPRVRALAETPGVTVTGSVDDVRPYVRRAALTVAPLQLARGTQNKVLEAMAMGVPVVASELAARGVDAVPERHLLAATAPEAMADAIVRVLADPDERVRLASAGRQLVTQHYTWSTTLRDLDSALARCLP